MIGILSNAFGLAHGGGVAAIAGWASVLREIDEVELCFPFTTNSAEIEATYGVALEGVRIVPWMPAPAGRFGRLRQRLARRRWSARFDLLVLQRTEVPFPSQARASALFVEFPFQRRLRWRERFYLGRFDGLAANSTFTAKWIERRWQRPATVIPPVVGSIPSRPKAPWIVNIGRFTDARRSKHQLELVHAFRQLVDRGARDWQLHLIGTVGSQRYLASVRAAAAGLPVVFHTDISRAELEQVVGQARIVWHASGAAHDEDQNPEWMEHFGIATAEAMSAGCIPVVIAKGGQREIVGEELARFGWRTWDACVANTRALIDQPGQYDALAALAQQRAAQYSEQRFRARLLTFARALHPRFRDQAPPVDEPSQTMSPNQ